MYSIEKKRKRVCLELDDKEIMVSKLQKGVPAETLALEYNVSVSTIKKVKYSFEKIRKHREENPFGSTRKTLKLPSLPELEDALKQWVYECRQQNVNITQASFLEKAKSLHNSLYPKPNEKKYAFTGSKGFVYNFCKRNGFNTDNIQGTNEQVDHNAVPPFLDYMKNIYYEGGYTRHQFYNASETTIFYKSDTEPTITLTQKPTHRSNEESKDQVIVMPCSNASGTHQLPLVIIGKAPKPQCYSGASSLDNKMYYISSKASVSMTQSVFTVWFHNEFVPQVKTFLRSKNLPEKAVLFLNRCEAHSDNLRDGDIFVFFFPQNTSSLIQPMDQGPINAIKKRYKTHISRNICHDSKYLKKINMRLVIALLVKVWAEIDYTIVNSWNNCKLFTQIDKEIDTIVETNPDCSRNFDEWLNSEAFTTDIQLLNDETILQLYDQNDKDESINDNESIQPTIQIDSNQIPYLQNFLLSHAQVRDYEKDILKSIFKRIFNNNNKNVT
jgi:hypothetical protein